MTEQTAITGQRCWHRNVRRQLDCENESKHECWHCKWLVCEDHTRKVQVDGRWRAYCVECYAALFGKAKQE